MARAAPIGRRLRMPGTGVPVQKISRRRIGHVAGFRSAANAALPSTPRHPALVITMGMARPAGVASVSLSSGTNGASRPLSLRRVCGLPHGRTHAALIAAPLAGGLILPAACNAKPRPEIGDVAGGRSSDRRALQSARAGADEDDTARMMLLTDVRAIFAERNTDKLSSAELVAALVAMEGRPWADRKAGRSLSVSGLARLLAPFRIIPGTIRTSVTTAKAYQLAHFATILRANRACCTVALANKMARIVWAA
jgi:hypothetical protein